MVHRDLDYVAREMTARQVQARAVSQALWNGIGRAWRAGGRSISLLSRSLLALGRAMASWWRHDRALRELASLDERMLKDIGLRRGDAWAVAHAYACGTVYRRGGEFPDAGDECQMNEAVHERALANEPRGELAFRMRMAPRLRKLLGGVVAGWQVFATARRIAAAVELHRMPAKEDLAFLGVEDATVFRRHIGQ